MPLVPGIRSHLLLGAVALLAACSEKPQQPAGEAPAVIAERQDNFEAISDNFKQIREELEKSDPDLSLVETAAIDINRRADLIEGYFPPDTGRDAGWDTEALPTIWERPEAFAEAHEKLIVESAEMRDLAVGGNVEAVRAQVADLGGSCKNCHDRFRLDDD